MSTFSIDQWYTLLNALVSFNPLTLRMDGWISDVCLCLHRVISVTPGSIELVMKVLFMQSV